MNQDRVENKEKPLEGKEIYFSGSIHGVLNSEPDFSWNLIQSIIEKGAVVLDTHVAGRNDEEKRKLFIEDNGFDANEEVIVNPWISVEEVDIQQVDRATHVISLVNGPSHGVGNEIQRAIDNFELLGKRTEILCLVQEDRLKSLSWMIKGKEKPKYPNFHLAVYKDLEDAKKIVFDFLLKY